MPVSGGATPPAGAVSQSSARPAPAATSAGVTTGNAAPITSTVVPGTLISADPLLAAQVQAIIDHPVAAQRPDLIHFQPLAAANSGPHGGARDGGGSAATATASPTFPMLAGALYAIALLALVPWIVVRLMRRPLPRPVALVPLALALPVTGVAVAMTMGALDAAAPVRSPAAAAAAAAHPTTSVSGAPQPGQVASAVRAHTLALPAGSASTAWTSLSSIEATVTSQQQRLVSDEQQISALTLQLGGQGSSAAEPSHTPAAEPPPPQAEGPQAITDRHAVPDPASLQSALQQAVQDHQTTQSAYNASLQTEYGFYVTAAQSPQLTRELQSVAAHVPPQVQTAVATDLTLVQTQLQQEARIAAAEAAATAQPGAGAAGGPAAGPVDATTLASQTALQFHAPVSGVVTQPFGPTDFTLEPPITYAGTFYPHFHTGLDIAAPLDTPVGAADAGTVILATSSVDSTGQLAGYGNYVVIAHGNGFATLYGHLDKLLVTPGETVAQGQVIGLLGSTGWSTGPHLHFEIRKDGVYVDPAPFLAAAFQP